MVMPSPFSPLPSAALPGLPPPGQGSLSGAGPSPFGPPGQVLDADYRLLLDDAENAIGPAPPPWYEPGKMPKPDEVQQEAQEQKQLHAQRVLTACRMDLLLNHDISAIFGADELWVQVKEIEPQASPILRLMHDAIVNFVAAQTFTFNSLARGLVNREERAAIENHLADFLDDAVQTTFREGQGSLHRVLTADALSGLVAVHHRPDPSNQRAGARLYRVDPKVVFPIFGRDGVDRVYTVYDAAFPEVIRDFGHFPGARDKIEKIARKGSGAGTKRIDTETCHELIGYWDREFEMVLWRGEVIHRNRHRLYVCPWHIGLPNWRLSAGAKSRANEWSPRNAPLDADGRPLLGMGLSRQAQLSQQYSHFLAPWVPTSDRFEKLLTRFTYGADRALSNPLVHKRSGMRSTQGPPEVQNYRHGVTELEEDEELDYLPQPPAADAFQPMWELMQLEIKAAIPTPILQGQTFGTQTSGNAIDVLNELGYAQIAPVPEFIGMVWSEIAHRQLSYIRDWNPIYRPGQGGGFPVATAQRGAYGADPALLTAEMLERSGCYVACQLSRFSLSGLSAAATSAAILDQQLRLGTRPYWIRQLGLSANALQLEDDRRTQDMEDAPGYAEAAQVQNLYDEMERAAALGDDESLRRAIIFGRRVAWKQTARDLMEAQQVGLLPPQDQVPPAFAANPMPMLGGPQMGRGVGDQGGAPTQTPQQQTQMPLPGQG